MTVFRKWLPYLVLVTSSWATRALAVGECKPGFPCQAARYEANTAYNYLSDGGVPRTPVICYGDGGVDGGSTLSDGGCAATDGGAVIFPFPALKVKTKETVLTAIGVKFNQLPPCPSIATSTLQWCTDCSGGDGGTGAYVACGTGGWYPIGGGGGSAGISPCTLSANGDLYCPGDGGFVGGVLIQEKTSSIFPDLQGLVLRFPGHAGWQLAQTNDVLDLAVGSGSPVATAVSQQWDLNTGNVTLNDLGFATSIFTSGLTDNRFTNSLTVGGDAGVLKNLTVGGASGITGQILTLQTAGQSSWNQQTGATQWYLSNGGNTVLTCVSSTGVCDFTYGATIGASAVATAGNGRAGGRIDGYAGNADLASTHADQTIACTRLQHPIVDQSAGRITMVVTKVGTTGGTFDMYVKNETNGQILCFKNGTSCTTAAGGTGSGASCTWDAGVVGDDVCLHYNTTSCTGTDPSGNITAEY